MIYLDHAATTPMLPEVREVVLPWLGTAANPSSTHAAGRAAAAAVDAARREVAALLGRDPEGIVFVSGATEANHTAIRGLAAGGARRFAAAASEHPSVHAALRAAGVSVCALPVGPDGVVALDLEQDVDALVLMAVNHETGVRQPVAEAVALARTRGLRLHVDATQALAGGPVAALAEADTIALSAHKLGGPAGVGALSLRSGGPFPALLPGAQERGRRGGTPDVAGIVGFGAACRAAARDGAARVERWAALAERLQALVEALGGRVVGDRRRASPAVTTAVFPGVRGDLLVQALDLAGIAASSGAACASGAIGPSPVLAAMGDPEPAGGLRVSFGPDRPPPGVDEAQLDALEAALRVVVPRIRAAAAWEAELG